MPILILALVILFVSVSPAQNLEPKLIQWGHTATMLLDGRVLLAGGNCGPSSTVCERKAQLFDPRSGEFRLLSPMCSGRWKHSAVLLPDGKVLLAGGWGRERDTPELEVFDPETETFSALDLDIGGDSPESALLLDNGKVLLIGQKLHLFDPLRNGAFALATGLQERFAAKGAKLPGGGVFVFGGFLQNVYWSDPFQPVAFLSGRLPEAGDLFAAEKSRQLRSGNFLLDLITLRNGKVLIAGGSIDPYGMEPTGDLDVYDPESKSYRSIAGGIPSRFGRTATQLPDGKIIFTGGASVIPWDGVELLDPDTERVVYLEPLKSRRYFHTATLLQDGSVLIVGGDKEQASAEILRPENLIAAPEIVASRRGDGLEVHAKGMQVPSSLQPRFFLNGRVAEILDEGPVPDRPELRQFQLRIPNEISPDSAIVLHMLHLERASNRVELPSLSTKD